MRTKYLVIFWTFHDVINKDDKQYKRVTIRLYHQGVNLRDIEKGENIGTKRQYLVKPGQFIMSRIDARNGAFGIIPEELNDAIITNDFLTFKVNSEVVNIEYFNLLSKTKDFLSYCINGSTGTTNRKRLKEDLFLNFEIELPSKEEQDSIIHKYNNISTKHRLLSENFREQKILLERLRTSYKIDAINGKYTKKGESHESSIGLLEEIKKEKNRLIESGTIKKEKPLLPIEISEQEYDLPEGWTYARLGDLLNPINGKAFKPSDWSEEGLPIIRIQNLNNPDAPFNRCNFSVDSKYHVKKGDLLIGWSGTPGTSFGAFIWDREDALLNQHIFKGVIYGDLVDKYFMQYAINSKLNEMISKAHGGVGLKHITKGKFMNLVIPLPPLNQQLEVVRMIKKAEYMFEQLEQNLIKSEGLGNLLLNSLLSLEQKR